MCNFFALVTPNGLTRKIYGYSLHTESNLIIIVAMINNNSKDTGSATFPREHHKLVLWLVKNQHDGQKDN